MAGEKKREISENAKMRLALLAAMAAQAHAFSGEFVSGVGDERFVKLLDTARRQWSTTEAEYQSVLQLYRGDWDGLMEGPTWGAWWTQNSYGTTMTALPLMDGVTSHGRVCH